MSLRREKVTVHSKRGISGIDKVVKNRCESLIFELFQKSTFLNIPSGEYKCKVTDRIDAAKISTQFKLEVGSVNNGIKIYVHPSKDKYAYLLFIGLSQVDCDAAWNELNQILKSSQTKKIEKVTVQDRKYEQEREDEIPTKIILAPSKVTSFNSKQQHQIEEGDRKSPGKREKAKNLQATKNQSQGVALVSTQTRENKNPVEQISLDGQRNLLIANVDRLISECEKRLRPLRADTVIEEKKLDDLKALKKVAESSDSDVQDLAANLYKI